MIIGFTATLVLMAAVGPASAGRLSTTEQGFTAIWPREAQLAFSGSGFELACEVTLEGSFHYRTFLKTRTLVGHVTKAIVGPVARAAYIDQRQRGGAFGIVNLNEVSGTVTGLTADSASSIPYNSGGFGFCPGSGTWSGTGRASGRGGGGTVTIRLI